MNANNILYETALKQFDTVAEMLNIEDGIGGSGGGHTLISDLISFKLRQTQ